jgi:hypothetical protein
MPKIFDRQDLPKTIKRINEDVWFDLFQPLLLKIVNTDYGRDLLCIKKEPFPIVFIRKNEVRYYLGRYNGRDYFMSDFRVGAKWANVIRYRWWDFRAYAKRFYEKELYGQKIYLPLLKYRGQYIAAHVTDTFYPDPDPEVTSVDGNIYREGDATFAAVRSATIGSYYQDNASVNDNFFQCGYNTNWRIGRDFFLFDTSSLPDNATINSATLGVYLYLFTGSPPSNSGNLGLVQSSPASNTALSLDDYDQVGTTEGAARVNISATAATQYTWTLNSTGLSWISKTGITKLALRHADDIDNNSVNYKRFATYFAESTGTTQDPKLVVVHSAAAKSRGFIFG